MAGAVIYSTCNPTSGALPASNRSNISILSKMIRVNNDLVLVIVVFAFSDQQDCCRRRDGAQYDAVNPTSIGSAAVTELRALILLGKPASNLEVGRPRESVNAAAACVVAAIKGNWLLVTTWHQYP